MNLQNELALTLMPTEGLARLRERTGFSVLSFKVRKTAEILDLQPTLIRMSLSWSELE